MGENRRAQYKNLIVLVLVIVIFGIGIVTNMLSANPLPQVQASNIQTRQPASVISLGQNGHIKQKPMSMPTYQLECIEKNQKLKFSSLAKQIRLKGQLCTDSELKTIKIYNRTNGFVATTFNLKKNKFTSDFINLAKGDNQILLSLEAENGETSIAELRVELNSTPK